MSLGAAASVTEALPYIFCCANRAAWAITALLMVVILPELQQLYGARQSNYNPRFMESFSLSLLLDTDIRNKVEKLLKTRI